MSNLYKGPSEDASYQVSVHLAKRFQRRLFFQKSTNQKQELSVAAMFVNGSELNKQSLERTCQGCFLPSSIHLAQQFQRRIFFRNQPIRNNNCMWRPCLLADRHEMSNLYREPAIDASYQPSFGSFGQAVSDKKIFKNRPIRNKNCLCRPCLLMDRDRNE